VKKIEKFFCSIILVLLAGTFLWLAYANHVLNSGGAAQPSPTENAQNSVPPAESAAAPAETENEGNVKLAFCGDVVCHIGLNAQAKKSDGTYDFTPIFSSASEVLSRADYASVTMETTFPEKADYSGFPEFKSPPALASGLKNIGIDLVNTASNHCMDDHQSGLIRTLDVLDRDGLDHVGTYRTQAERDKNSGILMKEINGVRIAFLSYTYGTNGLPVTHCEYAANILFKDYMSTDMENLDYAFLDRDMAAARALKADVTVVLVHWGLEYHTQPVDYQKTLADYFFRQGADVVIGGHCHVPEPMELHSVTDPDGNKKTVFLAYCLGNFVSCQNDRDTDLTAILNIDIEKNHKTGKASLKNVSYVPMFMADLNDYGIKASWRYRLLNLEDTLAAYKKGDNMGFINTQMYGAMEQGLRDLRGILGADFDIADNGGTDVGKWTAEHAGD